MSLKDQLRHHGFSFKKSLGQNFIQDPKLLDRIVQQANLGPADTVIEIGTGAGTLTAALAQRAKQVISLEVDQRLQAFLDSQFAAAPSVHILFQDALKTDLDGLASAYGAETYKVVANLPYYITTPLMMHILEDQDHCQLAILMMQKEVADRITSPPGSKVYGAISVMVQYYAQAEKAFPVHRSAFTPAPEVDSMVLALTPRPYPTLADSPTFLRDLVRAAFGQRRKKIANALSSLHIEPDTIHAALESCGISPDLRAEKLGVDAFVCLANRLKEDA